MLKQLLFSSGISLSGLVVMYTTGFLFLHALPLSRQLNARERVFFSPVFFFVYILILFFANWALQGQLLSSSLILILFFICSLLVLYRAGRRTIFETGHSIHREWQHITGKTCSPYRTPFNNGTRPARHKLPVFLVLLLAATLISCAPVLLGERFDADALDHLMWTNQFLNGKVFSSVIPYTGPGIPKEMYPFIVHVTAAFFARLFQVQAETGIIITTAIQALLYPLGLYFLILKITSNYRIALLAMVTGCFYFGHGYLLGLWWFNIPVQRLDMPNNICRMMSMAIAPFILYLFILTLHKNNKNTWILAGILTGIAGLIHPYFFSYAIAFSLVSTLYFTIKNDQQLTGNFLGILLISLILFSVILVPDTLYSIGNNLSFNGLTAIPQKFKGDLLSQVVITPYEYLISYGIIGILAMFSLFIWRQIHDKTFIHLLSVTILLLIAGTWAKEILFVHFNISVPYNPAQHKYGNTLFLICIILTSIVIRNLFLQKRWAGNILYVSVIACTLATTPNLIAFERYFIQQDPFFIQYHARKNIYRLVKTQLQPDDIIAVPDWWTRKFASFTGKDLLYINESNYYTPYRQLANILLFLPAGKKQNAIAMETGITYEELLQYIISYFKIDAVIAPIKLSKTFKKYSFCKYKGRGSTHLPTIKKIQFDIYQVQPKNISRYKDKSIIEKIFTNKKIFRIAVGDLPLITKRYVRLGIYNQRRKNFIALASINNTIFAINSTDHIVFGIDPDTGKIMQRIQLPAPPSAIAGFKNDLYIYFRKDNSLRKISLKKKSELKKLGTLSVPVGKIGSITFDGKGRLWFFAWSSHRKQYLLYSHNLSTEQTVQEGTLPGKRIYTGLAFEETSGTILISTRRGYYFHWSPEQQKILTRYYNGRIRPFGICMINSSLYAYNGLNHLIGKLEPLKN